MRIRLRLAGLLPCCALAGCGLPLGYGRFHGLTAAPVPPMPIYAAPHPPRSEIVAMAEPALGSPA